MDPTLRLLHPTRKPRLLLSHQGHGQCLVHLTTYLVPAHHQILMLFPQMPDLQTTRPPGLPPLRMRRQVESVTGYAGVGSLALSPEVYIALAI